MVSRLAKYGSQIVLAWLLEPQVFGIIGIVYSIRAFASIIQQEGTQQILTARQDEYADLANAGFWIAVTTGCLAGSLMAISAPLVADWYGNPELAPLLWILAAATACTSPRAVFGAKLKIDLRFDVTSVVGALEVFFQAVLTILLALLDYGVYSFVLPALLLNPVFTIGMYLLTRPPLRWYPEFGRWPSLLKMSGLLLVAAVFNKVVDYGDYLILAGFYSETEVGLYFMAYSLSVQAVMLLSTNLFHTFFPIFSKLRTDSARQHFAYIRVARLVAIVSIPISFLIAACAEPIIRLLLDDKWLPAIPVLQILAVGMSLRAVGGTAMALLNARAQFGKVMLAAGIRCGIFLVLTLGAVQLGFLWFAGAVAVAYLIVPVVQFIVALGFNSETFNELLRITAFPVLISTLLMVGVITALEVIPNTPLWDAGAIIGAGLVFTSVLVGSTYVLQPDTWKELRRLKEAVR